MIYLVVYAVDARLPVHGADELGFMGGVLIY
jgi:hypothetical protein